MRALNRKLIRYNNRQQDGQRTGRPLGRGKRPLYTSGPLLVLQSRSYLASPRLLAIQHIKEGYGVLGKCKAGTVDPVWNAQAAGAVYPEKSHYRSRSRSVAVRKSKIPTIYRFQCKCEPETMDPGWNAETAGSMYPKKRHDSRPQSASFHESRVPNAHKP